MATTLQDGEYISLSRLDVRVLVALLRGRLNAYEIGRQCVSDFGRGLRITNNTLYSSIKGLVLCGFVKEIEVDNPKSKKIYEITSTGRMVLGWELSNLENLVKLGRER